MKQYTATANDDGVRLSRFVQSVTRDFPTSLLYKSFRNKRVKVNGKKAVPEYRHSGRRPDRAVHQRRVFPAGRRKNRAEGRAEKKAESAQGQCHL